uniref:sulfurtransferase n=1 Tax=Nakamurella endophytica TaxID=1748367 RepID=UPI003570F8BD
MPPDLADPAWLAARLGSPGVVVLDVRWRVGAGSDHAGYLAGHIPGARFVDLDRELAAPPGAGGRHPLPDATVLQQVWRRHGIDDGSTVVVHDDADGSGAVRAWWLLRWSGLEDVRVLDGGLRAWTGALETGEPAPSRPGTVTVRPGAMPTVDMAEVAARSGAGHGLLLDARAAPRYRGEIEPLDAVAGHIPGAVNLPFAELYTERGTLRPPAELRERLEAAGVAVRHQASEVSGDPSATPEADRRRGLADRDGPRGTGADDSHDDGSADSDDDRSADSDADRGADRAVASCGSGVTACHLVLAGRVAGIDLALYPGSYSEWSGAGRPVATGPEPRSAAG